MKCTVNVSTWLFCPQHYLAMIGGTIAKPIILATYLCIEESDPARGALVSSIIFVSGLVTLLQSTLGVRSVLARKETMPVHPPPVHARSQVSSEREVKNAI
uniref:Uncharacterized protein n=1 Tax=Scylla olivacea TaxID=85551 RepID=A0A0P4WKG5_SCYOL